jgi:hypothetical protein
MAGWAGTDPGHEKNLTMARRLLAEGRGEELVAAQCWLDKTPLSAQTYLTICEAGSSADIYGDRESGALLGRAEQPVLISYGDDDIGITEIDVSIDTWLKRVNKFKNPHTTISAIQGASHSFKGYEARLAETVEDFMEDA